VLTALWILQIDDDFNLEGALAAIEAKPPSSAPILAPKADSPAPSLTPRESKSAPSKKGQGKLNASRARGSFQMLYWEREPDALSSAAKDAHAEALLAK
jgi:hypothetical protein